MNAGRLAARRLASRPGQDGPARAPTKTEECRETCDLYIDAIGAAERLIYIESQY